MHIDLQQYSACFHSYFTQETLILLLCAEKASFYRISIHMLITGAPMYMQTKQRMKQTRQRAAGMAFLKCIVTYIQTMSESHHVPMRTLARCAERLPVLASLPCASHHR